jgi:hypothetical protein
MRDFRITKLEVSPEGFWRARITVDGVSYPVNRRFGAWEVLCGEVRRELLPQYAAALQTRVRPLERRRERSAA